MPSSNVNKMFPNECEIFKHEPDDDSNDDDDKKNLFQIFKQFFWR